jgi:hypothetical protein
LLNIEAVSRAMPGAPFADAFVGARETLAGKDPGLPVEFLRYTNMKPEAERLLKAAGRGWVFGAMGSWNDIVRRCGAEAALRICVERRCLRCALARRACQCEFDLSPLRLLSDLKQRVVHFIGKADQGDASFRLRLGFRHLDESRAQVPHHLRQ